MPRTPTDDRNINEPPNDPYDADAARGSAAPDDVGDAPAEKFSDSESEVEQLRLERNSLYERLARATAEFQNIRKRNEQEADQRIQYANSTLIKSLLPVIDNFERAIAVDPAKADAASILKGMQIVHDQWLNVLKQQQVEELAPAPGTAFDPNTQQAIMQQESTYAVPTVVQLLQKGYALHGRTLRPAQVAVSKSV